MSEQSRMLTDEQTSTHFLMHYERALQELKSDELVPNINGLIKFSHSIILSLAKRRADVAGVDWINILQHDVTKLIERGHDLLGCIGHDHAGDD